MNVKTCSEETTNSSSTNYCENAQQAIALYNEWYRLSSFSRTVRRLAWVITVISTIVATIYFSFRASDSSEWFSVLLAAICITAMAVLGCGLIILLLKPFFWHRRKKAKRIHERLIGAESVVLSEDICIAQESVSDYINLKSSHQKESDNDFSVGILFDDYRESICSVYNNAVYVRELQMDRDRWGEWCWVMTACLVVLVAVAIAVALVILAVLIFIVLLWAVIVANTPTDTYEYRDYGEGRAMPSNEPSFLRIFFDSFHGRFLQISKAVSAVKTAIKENLTKKTAAKLLLQTKGMTLPESITLPYWSTRSK